MSQDLGIGNIGGPEQSSGSFKVRLGRVLLKIC